MVQDMGIRELIDRLWQDMIYGILQEKKQDMVVREKDIRRKALFLTARSVRNGKLTNNKNKTIEYVDNRFNDTILLTNTPMSLSVRLADISPPAGHDRQPVITCISSPNSRSVKKGGLPHGQAAKIRPKMRHRRRPRLSSFEQ